MSATPTPVVIRRFVTMRRLAAADAPARELAARRRATTGKGYRGPLTRAELAAQAAGRQDQDRARSILRTV